MIDRAVIQVDDEGEFPNSASCAAYLGFRSRGTEVAKKTSGDIADMEASPEHLVFGGAEVVRPYLARLGIVPPNLDYPEALRPLMGRDFEVTTLGEVRRLYNEPGPLVFVKPVEHKAFPGHLVNCFRDLIKTSDLPADTPVYKVEHVALESEWRVYVTNGAPLDIDHYKGNPFRFPSGAVIRKAVRAFQGPEVPAAYGLDVGVTEDGDTILVEVNDMFSLGSYGLDPLTYSILIERRWKELTRHQREEQP